MEIKGVLFDKDGTLLEFNQTWRPIALAVIGRLISVYNLGSNIAPLLYNSIGLLKDSIEPSGSLASGTNRDVALDLLKCLPANINQEEFIETSTKIFNETAASLPLYPVPQMLETLNTLKTKGLKIGMSTADSLVNAQEFVTQTASSHLFDYLGADDGYINPKPAPDYMEVFCRKFGLKPEEVAVVGDTQTDLDFAKNSSASLFIGVLTGTSTRKQLEPDSDLILDSIQDLIKADGSLIWEEI